MSSSQIIQVRPIKTNYDDVIVPGSARLTFNMSLESTEGGNRTLVNNKMISMKI